jgi:glycerol-3-phosphate dehydrogenase
MPSNSPAAAQPAHQRIGTAIIGGGVVGCAIARRLARSGEHSVFVFERNERLGEAQSGRNSGVVHAGVHYPPGSLKAELCVRSNALTYAFCEEYRVPCEPVGKFIVATGADELAELAPLKQRADMNGVPGVERVSAAEVREREPNVAVDGALWLPSTGVIDAASFTQALARHARDGGAELLVGYRIAAVSPLSAGGFRLHGERGGRSETFDADRVINAAGLYSDQVAQMIEPDFAPRIEPLRGEYCRFTRRAGTPLWYRGTNIYPVPSDLDIGGETLRMVGVHLTPTFELGRDGCSRLGGTVIVGPEFVRVDDPEQYEGGRQPLELFLARAQRMIPGLKAEHLHIDYTGIMASRTMGSDFIIRRARDHRDFIQLVGIDSPGLTAALAIAEHVQALI